MLRLIFWLALIAFAVWLWRRIKQPRTPRHDAAAVDAAPMVRCACCGVHVPKAQALPAADRWYCSQQHLAQGPQQR